MIAQGLIERIRPRQAAEEPLYDHSRRTGWSASRASRTATRRRRNPWASKRVRLATVIVAAVLAVLAGAWFWVRSSSLVAVTRVTVTGNTGPDATQIGDALRAAARAQTTLDVHPGKLRSAVAPYPVVRGIHVTTQFPHGMRILVLEQVPVAAVTVAGSSIPVAADGTLLHDAGSARALPTVPLRVPPGGPRLTEGDALSAVALLGAAPYQFLGRISQVSDQGEHGLTAQVRGGPIIYFGDDSDAAAKWHAATEVLADPGSAGASYIDVTDPDRPAAGVGTAAVQAAGLATGVAQSTASSGSGSTPGTSGSTDSTGTTDTSGTSGP